MPPGIFYLFLAANWCNMADSGGCCWGKFSALWSQGGGGEGWGSCDPLEPPPPPNDGPGNNIFRVPLYKSSK